MGNLTSNFKTRSTKSNIDSHQGATHGKKNQQVTNDIQNIQDLANFIKRIFYL